MINKVGRLDSAEAESYEAEKHIHGKERWFGKTVVQTATDWGTESSLTPYVAISGEGTWGIGATDEALVLGTADTPVITGMTKFDAHMIFAITLSSDTPYICRLVWGTGTMDAAVTALQYSTFVLQNIVTGSKAGGVPIAVMMPRLNCGVDQVWLQCMNATDDETLDFFIGIHEYIR